MMLKFLEDINVIERLSDWGILDLTDSEDSEEEYDEYDS